MLKEKKRGYGSRWKCRNRRKERKMGSNPQSEEVLLKEREGGEGK